MSGLQDRKDREKAARTFGTNLVVVAGAGTGKTSLLVERVLNAILSGTAPLDEMVVMTFTKKAAAELRERIAENLLDVILATEERDATEPAAHRESARALGWLREQGIAGPILHERAREALDGLEAASLGTIHGFATDLLRRHPRDADLPPEFKPDEGEERALLFQRFWPRFLAEELGPEGKHHALWQETLRSFPLRRVEEMAQALIVEPHVLDQLRREGYTEAPLAVDAETIPGLVARLEGYLPRLKPGSEMDRQARLQIAMLTAFREGGVAAALASFDAHQETAEKKFGATFWEKAYTRTVTAGPEKEAILDAATRDLEEGVALLAPLRGLETRDLTPLMGILSGFAERFDREAARAGMPAMDDLLIRARNLLRDHPRVRDREAARARMLLLDEFQDTDPLQYEIAFLLASQPGSEVPDDPFETDLQEGRLFIVGDPKQSIYRFRGADIAAYDRAVRRLVACGGEELILGTNFRSVPGVVEPVNLLFRSCMEEIPEVQPPYRTITAHRDPGEDGPVTELWSVPVAAEAKAKQRRNVEAEVVGDAVLSLVQEGTRPQDIALLFRAMGRAPLYTRALRERGIDFIVEGGKSFAERPEVVESLALLRALANPADPVATLAALRTTFGGVDDAELLEYARTGNFTWRVPEEALDRFPGNVAAAFRRLQALEKAIRRLPVERQIHAALLEGDFALLQASYVEGAQRIANVRKLAERAAAVAGSRMLSLDATLQAVSDDLQGDNKEWESPLADEGVAAVRVLTIHKAKGLEFPVVILPDLPRGTGGGGNYGRPVLRLVHEEKRPYVAITMDGRRNVAASRAKSEEKAHDDAELTRILYVAMTRAENRLIVINNDPTGRSPWVKALGPAWGYELDKEAEDPLPEEGLIADGHVRHRRPEPGTGIRTGVDRGTPVREAVERFLARRADEAARTWKPSRTPSADHKAEATGEIPALEEGAGLAPALASQVGTALHAVMEGWDFRDADEARALLEPAARRAAAAPFSPTDVIEGARGILDTLLASDLPGHLAGVEIVGREVPILLRDGDTTVHGYLDLLYRREGRLVVADYKSDAVKGSAAQTAAGYADQLTDYGEAVRRAFGLDELPILEVILLRTGERVEVAPVVRADA